MRPCCKSNWNKWRVPFLEWRGPDSLGGQLSRNRNSLLTGHCRCHTLQAALTHPPHLHFGEAREPSSLSRGQHNGWDLERLEKRKRSPRLSLPSTKQKPVCVASLHSSCLCSRIIHSMKRVGRSPKFLLLSIPNSLSQGSSFI